LQEAKRKWIRKQGNQRIQRVAKKSSNPWNPRFPRIPWFPPYENILTMSLGSLLMTTPFFNTPGGDTTGACKKQRENG
jgi:hypothetical protein